MSSFAEMVPTARVFTAPDGTGWTTKNRNRLLRAALAHVSLNDLPAHKREGDADYMALDWHGLRHTVRALLASRGHRDAAVGSLLGQSDPATLRRYDHAHAAERRAIADDLAGFLNPASKTAAEA